MRWGKGGACGKLRFDEVVDIFEDVVENFGVRAGVRGMVGISCPRLFSRTA